MSNIPTKRKFWSKYALNKEIERLLAENKALYERIKQLETATKTNDRV